MARIITLVCDQCKETAPKLMTLTLMASSDNMADKTADATGEVCSMDCGVKWTAARMDRLIMAIGFRDLTTLL